MNIKMKGIAGRWKRATGRSALLNMSSFSTAVLSNSNVSLLILIKTVPSNIY